MFRRGVFITLCCTVFSTSHVYADQAALPDPISLPQALALIDGLHPELLEHRLPVMQAEQQLVEAQSQSALKVSIDGRLRWFEQGSDATIVEDSDDHALSLNISKPLYDGGQSFALQLSAQHQAQSANLKEAYERERYRINVMRRFFDIILADIQAARDNEDMATAFVAFDKAQDRHELGKVSDVDLLAIESAYQDLRLKVVQSEGKARSTRLALALALNRPGEQPSQLATPVLDVHDMQLPDYDVLVNHVLQNNPQMMSLEQDMQAVQAQVVASRALTRPQLDASIERSEYSRGLRTADKWRAGVAFSIPVYDGGVSDAAVKKAQIVLNKTTYQRQKLALELRQQVRDLMEEFSRLSAEKQASTVFSDYRELYMDRSRALYEMEVKTDLGDAMIQISQSQLRAARQEFQMALLLAQLNWLAGMDVTDWRALQALVPVQQGG